jgi:Tol biopolymer transport system component
VIGGASRPVGDVRAGDAAWSPDGRTIAYTVDADLGLVGTDASNPRKIWTSAGRANYPVWAPDGRRLRLSVFDTAANRSSIWEVKADGGSPHALLPDFDPSEFPCCGRWTPNGRHYVFSAGRERQDLWVLAESWLPLTRGKPVRLTQGPLNYGGAAFSRDGRKLFANGYNQSGELVRCPLGAGECTRFLGGIDAWAVSFSQNGESLAYVLADGTLWRSRADGSEKLQLTYPPVSAAMPRWSPDGQQIAYFTLPTRNARIQIVPASGGASKEAIAKDVGSQTDASWSPDGRRMAFGRAIGGPEVKDITIQIAELESGEIQVLPESKGLFSPRWSPDGRFIAAISHDSLRLLLYEVSSRRWRTLVSAKSIVGYPTWTTDSAFLFFDEAGVRMRLRIADGHKETAYSYQGLRRLNRLGAWVDNAPDGSILTLRDTSLDEIFALALE